MLSIKHPEMMPSIRAFSVGIYALKKVNGELIVVIKYPKEGLLAAKLHEKIGIALVPYRYDNRKANALYVMFWDNMKEPRIIASSLFHVDQTFALIDALKQPTFEVYLFDEHSREHLGYSAHLSDREKFGTYSSTMKYPAYSNEEGIHIQNHDSEIFRYAERQNKIQMFEIVLGAPLYDPNYLFLDLTTESRSLRENGKIAAYKLERPEPGEGQEIDILLLLEKIFPEASLLLNPMKKIDGEELTDILVITPELLVFVQAKDSPNTETGLGTSIDRKRSKSISQIKEALGQLKGAVNFAKRNTPFALNVGSKEHIVAMHEKTVYGLIIIKEIFNEDMEAYTELILKTADEIKVTSVAMDYPELHHYSQHVDKDLFIESMNALFSEAKDSGIFRRRRFISPDSSNPS